MKNVTKQLERLSSELAALRSHILQYSGVDAAHAKLVDSLATQIAEEAAVIAAEARKADGNKSGNKLVAKVRKALGFTYP